MFLLLKMEVRDHEPKNVCSLEKLEKAREWVLFRASRREHSPATPQF